MPIKPKIAERIGHELLYPFSAMKLQLLKAMKEPRISTGSSVPFHVDASVIKKLQELNIRGMPDAAKMLGSGPASMSKMDTVSSKIYSDYLKNIVIRNGKPYVRQHDSALNMIKSAPEKTPINELKNLSGPENIPLLQAVNSAVFGKHVSPESVAIDSTGNLSRIGAAGVLAHAAKNVGIMPKRPVLIQGSPSLFSAPSSFRPESNEVILNNPLITTPTHELFHAKDVRDSRLSKIVPKIGQALAGASLVGAPMSILYGDEMSKVIPGTVDDKIIKAMKYAGPEMYLAGKVLQHSPEFYAVKNTKNVIGKNPGYFEELAAAHGSPGTTAKDLIDSQNIKARTYPSGLLSQYGMLRLGTLPLHLAKQSSPDLNISAKDYANVAKNMVLRNWQGLKEFGAGVKDPEVWKALAYHDSANKYKNISSVLPLTSMISLVPLIALGEYFKDTKKPKHPHLGPSYKNDIKQGLGA